MPRLSTPDCGLSQAFAMDDLFTIEKHKWSRPRGACSLCFSMKNTMEAKDLNFIELCNSRFPGQSWQDLPVRDQVDLIRDALRAEHFLIDRHSQYMKVWDIVLLVALVFTTVVTPYEVSFTTARWGLLFWVSRTLDFIFIKDMCMQFFLKSEFKRKEGHGKIILRDPKLIRRAYLRQWFGLDLICIIPFDLLSMLIEDLWQQDSGRLRGVKIVRCIRVLRLIKLLRMLRTSRLVLRWQNYFALSFAFQKLIKFMCILTIASHWMACLWGLAGQTFGRELCDQRGVQVVFEQPPRAEVSWVTTLFLAPDGKWSPDSPCNHQHLYAAALHWSAMTITSIGYGDIVPVRYEEYLVCVVCQIFGGLIWAYIVGVTCSILSNADPIEEKFEESTDLLNLVMRETRVPIRLRQLFREYLREAKAHDSMRLFKGLSQDFSPLLRGHLMLHMSVRWVSNVYYFKSAPQGFIVDVAEQLQSNFYARREPLLDIAFCLCIVERGTIAHGGVIVTTGSVFQKDMIITLRALQHVRPTVSLTYCQIQSLVRESLEEILTSYPSFARVIRKSALKLALCRVAKLCAHRSCTMTMSGLPSPSLSEAFGMMSGDIGTGTAQRFGRMKAMKGMSGLDVAALVSEEESKLSMRMDRGVRDSFGD